MTRREMLVSTGAAVMTSVGAAELKERPLFSFGLIADCQYADAEVKGTRHYRESPRKLREAVAELNQHDLEFTFHLGDFIDHDFKSFDALDPIVEVLDSRLYHALGNHDYDVADDLKTRIPERLGMDANYYSFRKDGFRFLVIDTTDVSPYRFPEKCPEDLACEAELKNLLESGSPSAKPWNGRPGDQQIAWIEGELKAATAADEPVLVLGHHPILPNTGHSIWNALRIDALLQKYPCAKLYLNGHNHAGAYTNSRGFHYLTLDGMLETKDQNAFGYAKIYPGRLDITGFGRQESYSLAFR